MGTGAQARSTLAVALWVAAAYIGRSAPPTSQLLSGQAEKSGPPQPRAAARRERRLRRSARPTSQAQAVVVAVAWTLLAVSLLALPAAALAVVAAALLPGPDPFRGDRSPGLLGQAVVLGVTGGVVLLMLSRVLRPAPVPGPAIDEIARETA